MADLQEELVRAQYAKELLDNPVFKDTWTEYREWIVTKLESCPPRDEVGREKLFLMLQTLAQFRSMVNQTIETGKLATAQLDRKNMLERAVEWIGRDGLTA